MLAAAHAQPNLLTDWVSQQEQAVTALIRSPATEFIEGKVLKFSTKNHPQANGAIFSIKYPASWTAKEGDRPNIIQILNSESGRGLEHISITCKSIPPELPISDSDLKQLLSPEGLKAVVPKGGEFVRGIATKIEGVPAGILEYSILQDRVGLELNLHVTVLIFFQGQTMVQVQNSVGVLSSKVSELPAKIVAFEPLFQLIMNSIVFEDK